MEDFEYEEPRVTVEMDGDEPVLRFPKSRVYVEASNEISKVIHDLNLSHEDNDRLIASLLEYSETVRHDGFALGLDFSFRKNSEAMESDDDKYTVIPEDVFTIDKLKDPVMNRLWNYVSDIGVIQSTMEAMNDDGLNKEDVTSFCEDIGSILDKMTLLVERNAIRVNDNDLLQMESSDYIN